jgi:hypothetical protein
LWQPVHNSLVEQLRAEESRTANMSHCD